MKRPELTVCILAKNEETNLVRALESVKDVAKEVVVVDTGSTDNTVAIAQSYGAKVVHYVWNDDFAAARNVAIEHASQEWVLMLDADEAVTPAMAAQLPQLLSDPHVDAYVTQVANVLRGKAIDHAPVIRLFRRKPGFRYTGIVHEEILSSIEAAGGRIKAERVVIEHYGYTPEEDRRKSRRERNLRLLQKMVEQDPESRQAWAYLGQEYALNGDYGAAEVCLRKAVQISPTTIHGAHAAYRLIRLGLRRYRLEHGWRLASIGEASPYTRWDSAYHRLQVALYEGDFLVAERLIQTLKSAPSGDFATFERSEARLAGWQAEALWLKGDRQAALAEWEKAMEVYPTDPFLAAEWIDRTIVANGLATALASGRSRASKQPSLFVGMSRSLLRAGELELAAMLAREGYRSGYSGYFLYALALTGDGADIISTARDKGIDGAVHMATAGVWLGNEALLAEGLKRLPKSWRCAFQAVLAGDRVGSDLQWAVDLLMAHWADVGCWPLLRAGAESLGELEGPGRAAWILWHTHQQGAALQWALEQPEHPDSLEVLGLMAAEQGDHEAAARFLADRINRGPARVAVYAHAARALAALGQPRVARAVLELGREQHPWSLLLRVGAM